MLCWCQPTDALVRSSAGSCDKTGAPASKPRLGPEVVVEVCPTPGCYKAGCCVPDDHDQAEVVHAWRVPEVESKPFMLAPSQAVVARWALKKPTDSTQSGSTGDGCASEASTSVRGDAAFDERWSEVSSDFRQLPESCILGQEASMLATAAARAREGAVEIDLSSEFPPEKRQAQVDLAVADWWSPANLGNIRSLQSANLASRLLAVRAVSHGVYTNGELPWRSHCSDKLYEAMGMCSPDRRYLALWLNLSGRSLVMVAEAFHRDRLEASFSDNPLMRRLKLVLNPVRLAVPCPVKGPAEMETIGTYFGSENISLQRRRTSRGVDYRCLQIDMHSKVFLRLLLQNVAFCDGNVVELLLVDWPGQSVLVACRLYITAELLRLLELESS